MNFHNQKNRNYCNIENDDVIIYQDTEQETFSVSGLGNVINNDNNVTFEYDLTLNKPYEHINKKQKKINSTPFIHKNTNALCIHRIGEDADAYIKIMKKFKKIWFFQSFSENLIGLHDDIDELVFGTRITSENIQNYPISLKKFVVYCDIEIDNLPEGLEVLHLMGSFNKKINNLPNTVKEIVISSSYTHVLEDLPSSLENLEINIMRGYDYYSYDQKPNVKKNIVSDFPNSLKKLSLLGQIIIPTLPTQLKVLELSCFNDSIEGILPETLEELSLDNLFNQPICNKTKSFLPPNLKKLKIGGDYCLPTNESYKYEIDHLPDCLEELCIYSSQIKKFGKLPTSLKKFEFHSNNNFYENFVKIFHNFGKLPETLEEININYNKYSFENIPSNCKKLILTYSDNLEFFDLPTNLEYLEFTKTSIPIAVENSIYYNKYNDIVERFVFPDSLVELELSYFNSDKIKLNQSLKILKISDNFFGTSETKLNDLPDSIEELSLHTTIKEINNIPKSLKRIWCYYTNRDIIENRLNKNIEYKETGMLERQHAASNFFSFF